MMQVNVRAMISHTFSSGVPNNLNIRCNWSLIELPGKSGRPEAISE